MKPDRRRRLDSTTAEVVEDIVIDWMNKYSLDDGNLAVTDFDNPEQIKAWVAGVWGRITHQLNAGLPYDENTLVAYAGECFYNQVSRHRSYEKIKPYLPRPVTMHGELKEKRR
jgi:hypothetical protein